MEIAALISNLAFIIVIVIGGLLLKTFLPSYLDKKGENLATKEDIQEITQLTEAVQDEFRRKFNDYDKDRSFKYQYYYDQFRVLYTKLYSIIAQSEYLRRFYKLHNGSEFSFDETPYIELNSSRSTQSISFTNALTTITSTETKISDAITEFNKKAIFDLIIDNGEYASQRLLKLAVAYRFVYKHYAGTDPTSDVVKTANEEEFTLIKEIIYCVIKEFNFYRSELKLDFIQSELDTGMFENLTMTGEDS